MSTLALAPHMNQNAQSPYFVTIGCGNMGGALAVGALNSGFVQQIHAVTRSGLKGPLVDIPGLHGTLSANIQDLATEIKKAAFVMLAVKPQDAPDTYEALKSMIDDDTFFVSIMAGVHTSSIQKALGPRPVARIMPNLATKFGEGACGYSISPNSPTPFVQMVEDFARKTSKVAVRCTDENQIHGITAISGSGPAYPFLLKKIIRDYQDLHQISSARIDETFSFFRDTLVNPNTPKTMDNNRILKTLNGFYQGYITAAHALGFSKENSLDLVRQTMIGAQVIMERQPELSPAQLIKAVASRGGTTEAAMYDMNGETDAESTNFKKAVRLFLSGGHGAQETMDYAMTTAVLAAEGRSYELAGDLKPDRSAVLQAIAPPSFQ